MAGIWQWDEKRKEIVTESDIIMVAWQCQGNAGGLMPISETMYYVFFGCFLVHRSRFYETYHLSRC